MGDFKLKGADLRKKGINRIGKVPTTFEMNCVLYQGTNNLPFFLPRKSLSAKFQLL